MFQKIVQAFAAGDLPYADFQSDLKRLIATGASSDELREVLRRHEEVDALPAFARADVLRTLDEAATGGRVPGENEARVHATASATPDRTAETESAQSVERARVLEERVVQLAAQFDALSHAYDRVRDAGSAASARVTALTAELAEVRGDLEQEQSKARDLGKSLTERSAADKALRARYEDAQREHEHRYADLRTERDAMASELNAARVALAAERQSQVRESDLREEVQPLREALAARESELLVVRSTLASSQNKIREFERSLTQRRPVDDAARTRGEEAIAEVERQRIEIRRLRDQLASRELDLAQLHGAVGERDAALVTQRDAHAAAIAALDRRAKNVEAELQAARSRVDEITAELKATHAAAVEFNAEHQSPEPAPREWPANTKWQQIADAARASQFNDLLTRPISALGAQTPPAGEPPPVIKARRTGGTRLLVRAGAIAVVVAVGAWLVAHRAPVPTPAARTTANTAPVAGAVLRDCPHCPAMTVLPAGRFKQGSAGTGADTAFERPLHWVSISRPFALSTDAVTVDEFRAFVSATGRAMEGCDVYDGKWRHSVDTSWKNPGFPQTGTHPVTCVSWDDATAYAQWLSTTTGQRYRLPSASEWEYAARAGGEAVVPWSADGAGACAAANVADKSAARRYPGWRSFACDDGYIFTAPVGSFAANGFGLHDMLGNVFQWTADCWHEDYRGAPVDGSARSAPNCADRELRGGSWFTTPAFMRANYRNHFGAGYRGNTVGIRLARDIAPGGVS